MSTHSTSAQVSRADKDRARKRAKRARESQEEIDSRRKKIEMQCHLEELLNQKLNEQSVLLLINSERLIAELLSQMVNVHRVLWLISSERPIVELLSQRQSTRTDLLLVSSERLIAELQNLRIPPNRARIATYRVNTSVGERQHQRENDRINAARRRNTARQSTYDRQRDAVNEFRQSIYTGPLNPCYCCTRLCYNNGGSFIDPSDPLLLPIHDRELSESVQDSDNTVWICSRCKTSLKKHKLPPFASVNNMQVPPVPYELSYLNSMEKRLICRIQPFMKLIVLPYGQGALKGQTVNFPVNTSEICSSLPKTSGIVLVAPSRTDSSDSTEVPVPQNYFSIRRPYIIRALQWLQQHNSLYRDIEIEEVSDDEPLSLSPVNDVEFDEEGESSVIRRDLQLPNVEVSDLINNNAPVHQLQCVQGAPISIYTCTNAEQMAFPWLYPDGTNGYKTSRDPPITTLDYFQSRHLSSDARWASHIPYLFWSINVLEQRRLNENISVAIRMRSSGNSRTRERSGSSRQSRENVSHDEDQNLTAGDLRDLSSNPELSDSCYGFMHNMRGTIAYWQRAKLDLLAMFRTLGPPTFFITLTADDMNWPDLLYVLAKRAGMDISKQEVDSMSSEQKRELLCSDPVTTARSTICKIHCVPEKLQSEK